MGTKHFNVSVLVFLCNDYEKVAENSRHSVACNLGDNKFRNIWVVRYANYIYIYKGHPSVERVLSDSHDALLNVGCLVLANYLIIVLMFICLWRKGGKR